MSIYFEATSQTTAERVACHNDDIYYMCGCIIPGVSSLNGNVFTCLESVFLSPIRLYCYGAKCISSKYLSVYCGETDSAVKQS